jgi:hypothetical protein
MKMKLYVIASVLAILSATFIWVGLGKQESADRLRRIQAPTIAERYGLEERNPPSAPTPPLAVFSYFLAAAAGIGGAALLLKASAIKSSS